MSIQIGKVFNSQYEIISELWNDGISTSYKAYDLKSQTYCEIQEINLANTTKEDKAEFLGRSLIQSSMEFERHLLATVRNIISNPLFSDRFYIVKEYYEATLQKGHVYKEKQAVEWVSQIASILLQIEGTSRFFAEGPVAFKQIDPANIKMRHENIILDFYAIIDISHLEAQRRFPVVERTPAYVLGALLFTLLTGRNLSNGSLYREDIVGYLSEKNVTSRTTKAIVEAVSSASYSGRKGLNKFFNTLQRKDMEEDKHAASAGTATSGCVLPIFYVFIFAVMTIVAVYVSGLINQYQLPVTATPTATATATWRPNLTQTVSPPSFELVKTYEIKDTDILGELSINYPLWLRPGTGELVKIAIQIPSGISNISIVNGHRIDLPATVTPYIGELSIHKATIVLDNRMRIELASSTIEIQLRTPAIQDVEIDKKNVSTLWIWGITAPKEYGNHRLDVSVFLDEDSQQPSWFQSYQVEVVEPTNTPTPSHTPTLTPSRTPSPTTTLTFTPTPSYYQSMVDNARNDPWKALSVFLGIPAVIALILASIWKILLPYLRWRQKIKNLEFDKKNATGNKKKAIEKELSDLKENWFSRIWVDGTNDKDNK